MNAKMAWKTEETVNYQSKSKLVNVITLQELIVGQDGGGCDVSCERWERRRFHRLQVGHTQFRLLCFGGGAELIRRRPHDGRTQLHVFEVGFPVRHDSRSVAGRAADGGRDAVTQGSLGAVEFEQREKGNGQR